MKFFVLVFVLFLLNCFTYVKCSCRIEKAVVDCKGLTDFPAGNDDVEVLRIHQSTLGEIKDYAFFDNNLFATKEVLITNSGVNILHEKAFSTLNDLLYLSLSQNDLKNVTARIFADLKSLKKLDISRNKLFVVHSDVFSDLISIEHIDVSYNNLKYQDLTVIQKLTYLKILVLSNNPFESRTFNNSFSSTSLQELYMSSCNINMLPDYFFNNLPNLMDLDLSHNKLITLSEKTFAPLKSLTYFDFSSNEIGDVSDISDFLLQIPEVYASNNPFLNSSSCMRIKNKVDCVENYLVPKEDLYSSYQASHNRNIETTAVPVMQPDVRRSLDNFNAKNIAEKKTTPFMGLMFLLFIVVIILFVSLVVAVLYRVLAKKKYSKSQPIANVNPASQQFLPLFNKS